MKKIFIILTALVICFTGCKKFLDVKPAGARFLNDVDAVANTMAAWMRNFTANSKYVTAPDAPYSWVPYQHGSTSPGFASYIDVWSFRTLNERANVLTASEKRTIDRGTVRGDWGIYYTLVGLMNLVITEGKVASGDETLRDHLLGEAYTQRAYYFFKLLQYYAPTDDPSTGIPVYLEINNSVAEADLSRKSQATVYKQIFSDLHEAEIILARTAPSKTFNVMFSADWIYRITSQVYHYKASTASHEEGDWANAVKYTELALKAAGKTGQMITPFGFDDLYNNVLGMGTYRPSWNDVGYPETLGIGGTSSNYMTNSYNYSIDVWNTLYKDGDLRKTHWFLAEEQWGTPSADIVESDITPSRKVWKNIDTGAGYFPNIFIMRLSEQWLIRTEALAMSGDITGAQAALTTWRSLRYESTSGLTMPSTAEDIQHEVYLERKREFFGEGDILWLDMKRFKISDTRHVQDFTATLESNDFRYQFAIPSSELTYNPTIVPNPGWSGLAY